jgi:hypothetical protein
MNLKPQCLPAFTAAALVLCAGAVVADPGPLDGRKFEGVFIERGKTSGDADTLTFKDGRFRSSACDRYGYSDAPYKSTPVGDAIAFEAETQSAKYGRLAWKGVIRDGKLDATAVMLRQGKPPVENWVVAAGKP